MTEPLSLGSASRRVRELVEQAQSGGRWYEVNEGTVAVVETNAEHWWSGQVYNVTFASVGGGSAASFVLDIADDGDVSPGSSSPWDGWAGWLDGQLAVAWQNSEINAQGADEVPLSFEVDDEPTDEQWARLARHLVEICFSQS